MPATKSKKRRRSINIYPTIISALKEEAKSRGVKSPTTLASMIVIGEAKALTVDVPLEGKRKGVSMTEATWLSIKARAEKISEAQGVAIGQPTIFTEIILGKISPLSEEEISLGLTQARQREEDRANNIDEPIEKKKDTGKVNDIEPETYTETTERDDSRFSFSPKPEKQSKPSEFEIEEFYGGVKLL